MKQRHTLSLGIFALILPATLLAHTTLFHFDISEFFSLIDTLKEITTDPSWLFTILGFGLFSTIVTVLLTLTNAAYLYCHQEVIEAKLPHHQKYVSVGLLLFMLSLWMLIYSYFPAEELVSPIATMIHNVPAIILLVVFAVLLMFGLPAIFYKFIEAGQILIKTSSKPLKALYTGFIVCGIIMCFGGWVMMVFRLLLEFPEAQYSLIYAILLPLIISIEIFLVLRRTELVSTKTKWKLSLLNVFALFCLGLYLLGFGTFLILLAYLCQLYSLVNIIKRFSMRRLTTSMLLAYCYYDFALVIYTTTIIHQLTIPTWS